MENLRRMMIVVPSTLGLFGAQRFFWTSGSAFVHRWWALRKPLGLANAPFSCSEAKPGACGLE